MRWKMIQLIEELDPGVRAVGINTFSPSDFFFRDHFPGYPTVPGVLEIEMIAQVAANCIRARQPDKFAMLSHVRSARFYKRVTPAKKCVVSVNVIKLRSSYALVSGRVDVEGVKTADAEILLALAPQPESSNDMEPITAENSLLAPIAEYAVAGPEGARP
jgi:3-hydroxyacyl-[acyl-carrier-protein] dehydratase